MALGLKLGPQDFNIQVGQASCPVLPLPQFFHLQNGHNTYGPGQGQEGMGKVGGTPRAELGELGEVK